MAKCKLCRSNYWIGGRFIGAGTLCYGWGISGGDAEPVLWVEMCEKVPEGYAG